MTRNRDGLYRQPGSPFWWASYTDGNGKRRRRSTEETNRKAAARVRGGWLVDAGRGPTMQHADQVTWDELKSDLEADYNRKGNRSWERVARALAHLQTAFGSSRAVDITANRICGYDDARMSEGASPASRRYELAVLRRAFRVAVQRGKLQTVPAFPSITVNNAREEFITDDDLAALLIELPDYLRHYAVFRSLTGMRKRESLDLAWRQVDEREGVIRLARGSTKNREPRTFPYANYPALKAVVEAQRAYSDHWERLGGQEIPWVFHRRGHRIKSYDVAWRAACRRAGVLGADGRPKIMHDFRRTAARFMEQAGIPRSVAMKLTGHLTENIFKRYAVVSEGDLSAATAKLAAAGHKYVIAEGENARSEASADAS